ncbi:MAG: DUF4159 domain-containing protein [Bacteroidota bacterium]
MKFFLIASALLLSGNIIPEKTQQNNSTYQFAVLKYNGGGDWYSNPTSVPNLVEFCNKNLGMNINKEVATVEAGSPDIFNYPFIHMTGHGNVVFNNKEAENLRNYLIGGGFLHISDNYGMDKFIRKELEKVFPDNPLTELPPSHPVYHQKYEFKNGLPKVHEHDNKPAQGFGITYEGRLVIFYDFECDLGDGWEDPSVHNDSEEARLKALKMGANIVQLALMGANE